MAKFKDDPNQYKIIFPAEPEFEAEKVEPSEELKPSKENDQSRPVVRIEASYEDSEAAEFRRLYSGYPSRRSRSYRPESSPAELLAKSRQEIYDLKSSLIEAIFVKYRMMYGSNKDINVENPLLEDIQARVKRAEKNFPDFVKRFGIKKYLNAYNFLTEVERMLEKNKPRQAFAKLDGLEYQRSESKKLIASYPQYQKLLNLLRAL